MIADDVAFLLVAVVPLFAARWRVSVLGLALQGLLLWRAAGGGWLDALDFLVLRGVAVPVLLTSAYAGEERNDVIPANLFAWGFVGVLTFAAFALAGALDGGGVMEGRIAAATAGLLLGFFVLASQDSVFSQIVGVLRIENAVALFELVVPREHADPVVRVGQLAATAGAALLAGWYLRRLRDFTPRVAPPGDTP